ncbi:MAG: DUF4351 domain-containing protein [Dolichospermum sp.]
MTVLRESPWYQQILKEGLETGEKQGLQQALKHGLQQGLQQGELTLVMRQLSRRFGDIDNQIILQIRQLEISQLELLAESLLDFTNIDDLTNWLKENNSYSREQS